MVSFLFWKLTCGILLSLQTDLCVSVCACVFVLNEFGGIPFHQLQISPLNEICSNQPEKEKTDWTKQFCIKLQLDWLHCWMLEHSSIESHYCLQQTARWVWQWTGFHFCQLVCIWLRHLPHVLHIKLCVMGLPSPPCSQSWVCHQPRVQLIANRSLT